MNMQAVVCRRLGPPEVMEVATVSRPEVGPGQLLVESEAVGVNFVDTMRRSGHHPFPPSVPFTPGIEVCGRVAEVGLGVHRFRPGDRVLARTVTGGAYAEAVLAEARFTVACPDDLPSSTAAAIFVNGQTAWHALFTLGELRPDDTVLITAAAGGVGLWAVQLAARLGATVIAATGSPAKCQLALSLGATHAVNYEQDGWIDHVRDCTPDGRGASLILESVGGEVADGCLECWAQTGCIVIYGEASGTPANIPGDRLLFGHRIAKGLAMGTILEDEARLRHAADELFLAVQNGLQVPIGGEFPLERAVEAHRQMASRQTSGKLVLTFPS